MAHQLYLKENLIITSNKSMWGITYIMGIHQNKNKNWNGFVVKVLLRCKHCSKDLCRETERKRERKTQKQRENL